MYNIHEYEELYYEYNIRTLEITFDPLNKHVKICNRLTFALKTNRL